MLNPPPKGPEPQRGPPTSGGDPDGRKQQQQDITDFDEKGHSAVLPSKNIDIHDPEQIQKAVDEMQERIARAEIFEKSVGGGANSKPCPRASACTVHSKQPSRWPVMAQTQQKIYSK